MLETFLKNNKSIEKHFNEILKLVPHKMSRTRIDLPWFNQNLKREEKRRQRLFSKCKQLGHSKSEKGKKKLADYKTRLAQANKSFKSNLKKSRWQYINSILCTGLESGNNKPFWKFIRGQRQESVGVSPLKDNGVLHSDRKQKSEILAKQFRSVFTNDEIDPFSDEIPTGPSYPPISEIVINENGISKLLKNLNPNKAAGPDQIPCHLLKELACEVAPVLASIFRQSLSTGELPDSWLTAWITPVFKKGPKNDPSNYRPVSLTCVICKVLEHVVCSHMRSHFDKFGILSQYQHGFRKFFSCESQLLLTTHDLMVRVDRKEPVDVAVLDFSKAFDTVPHRRLLRKLELLGIRGELLSWIRAFLTGRTQSVMIEGCFSQPYQVESGVPQGTVLGPLLFLCYINDLPNVLDPHTAVRLFADDLLIYRSIKSQDDQVKLQRDLHALGSWGERWGMKFNTKKCNIMLINNQGRPRFYELCNDVLGIVQSAKYLGVTISDDLSWTPHISSIVTKAHQRLGFIRRNLRGSPYAYRAIAYKSLVRSQLEYCCTIWDTDIKSEINSIERVQR